MKPFSACPKDIVQMLSTFMRIPKQELNVEFATSTG